MKRKLLYIEDELELQVTYKYLFELEGYEVKALSTAHGALEVVKEYKPDIIVCDNNLPNLTGVDFFELLKSKGIKTPFILISGDISERNLDKIRSSQITHVLEKPCEFEYVCELIKNAIHSQASLIA